MPRKVGKENASFQQKCLSRVKTVLGMISDPQCCQLGLAQPSTVYGACVLGSCGGSPLSQGSPEGSLSPTSISGHTEGKGRRSVPPRGQGSKIRGNTEPAHRSWAWRQARGGQEGAAGKSY